MKLDKYLNNIEKAPIPVDEAVAILPAVLISIATIVKFIVIMSIYMKMFKIGGIPSARQDTYMETKLEEIVKEKVSIGEYRSQSPNACAYPNGKMYYSSSLKAMLTEPELIAIMLHEFGHVKEKHSRKRVWGTETVGLGFELLFCALALIPGFGIVFAMWGWVLSAIVKGFALKKIVRRTELEADSYAKKYGYGKELASSLQKIEAWIHEMIKRTWKDATPEQVKKATDTMQKNAGYPTFKERIEQVLNFAPIRKIIENASFASLSIIPNLIRKTNLFNNLEKK